MVLPFILYYLAFILKLLTDYRKMRNLQINVNKLVGKVSINLLHHTKSDACVTTVVLLCKHVIAKKHM